MKLKSLAIAFAIALSSNAYASAIYQLKNFGSTTKSAKGTFTQTKKSGKGTATGTFEFSRPGKFVWEYTAPYQQLLQADGKNVYVYDKDLNQVTTKPVGEAIGSSPASILFGNGDFVHNFNIVEDGESNGLEWARIMPKSKDATFDLIRIGMRNNMPEVMEIHDSFGQTTVITFRDMEKNPSLDSSHFKFQVPKGADVN